MSRGRLEYGWIVVGGLCITETVSWGILYYAFAVFLRAMEVELAASRVDVTGAFSIGLLVAALAAIPVGRWIDRHGARALMTLGSCLGTVLVLAWSRVESLGALYAVWGMMGLALAATLYEPAFAAVVGWFTRHRDRALLVLTLAAGLASTIFMPLATWLLGRLGWRPALVALAVVLAVMTIPIHALVLRRSPRSSGADAGGSVVEPAPGLSLGAALRTTIFWVLGVAFVVSNFATVSVTVHLIPYLLDRGYAMSTAAAAVGWIGAMQLPGRLLFAQIASLFGPRWVTASIFLVQGLAIGQLAFLDRLPTLVPFVVLLGAANGMSTLARATIVAEIFGSRNYASIAGALSMGTTTARAVGPVGASLLHAGLGAYAPVFGILTLALVGAGVGVLLTEARAGGSAAD